MIDEITKSNLRWEGDRRLEAAVILNKMTQNPSTDDVCNLKFKIFSL